MAESSNMSGLDGTQSVSALGLRWAALRGAGFPVEMVLTLSPAGLGQTADTLLHLEETDLDGLVDGVEGVTAFFLAAGDGQVVFI